MTEEEERVHVWRLKVLLDAGYPLELATELAISVDVDLHRAVELLADGCPPATAAQILL
jgi:hypothetical protein